MTFLGVVSLSKNLQKRNRRQQTLELNGTSTFKSWVNELGNSGGKISNKIVMAVREASGGLNFKK